MHFVLKILFDFGKKLFSKLSVFKYNEVYNHTLFYHNTIFNQTFKMRITLYHPEFNGEIAIEMDRV